MSAAVSALAVAVATAVTAVGGGTAGATGTTTGTAEITLTDPASTEPRTERPLVAGESGYLHRQSGVAGLLWTDYTTGATVTVSTADGVYTPTSPCAAVTNACRTAWYGSDGDLVALPTALSSKSVTLWDPATRTTSTVTSAYYYRALAGETVVTGRTLIDFPGGERRERTVTGDAFTIQDNTVAAADAHGVLVKDGTAISYVDVDTAVETGAFGEVAYGGYAVMSDDRIGWYDADNGDLHLKSRTDPAAEEQTYDLPYLGEPDGAPVLTGDRLLLPLDAGSVSGTKLAAVSLTDGSSEVLLAASGAYALPAPGDNALVSGGTGADDWWLQRVGPDAEDGTPTLTQVARTPAVENAKTGLALSRGALRVVESGGASSVRVLTTDGGSALQSSAGTDSAKISAACPYTGVTCVPLWGNTGFEPNDVYLTTYTSGTDQKLDRIRATGSSNPVEFGTSGGKIVDVSDDYVVYQSGGTSPAQYVWELDQGQQLKRSVRAAALNGSTLWSATSATGQVTSYSLTAAKTLATVPLPGAGCVPTELQAAGRWLYWACGTASAGVYDTKAGTSVAVTPGDVLLGDGFTVRHDHTTDELVLTEAATGTTRTLASGIPDTGQDTDRRYRWTVDEYTGLVAWFDSYERTHVATTGVPPSAPTAFRTEINEYLAPLGAANFWSATWLLSRPATAWSLTFTSVQSGPTGRATRTITGGAATAHVDAQWNGLTPAGVRFPNGAYTWTLRATGLGTTTAATVAGGTGFIHKGSPVRHDYGSIDGPDGIGDLLTLTTSGSLTVHRGTGSGKFSEKITGTGWPRTITAVPFGDLSGDRCNDVLVRLSSGALRLYKPGCNSAVKPSTAYTTLATGGWNQYDVLTSPGDVTGDGRPDLITRASSTGTVYLHKGTSTGKLSSRVKLYDNLKTYRRIVGAGDLNGDGIGDLLAQDKANTLYRYLGTGKGTFSARVKLFAAWGASYNAVVGVGDINRDGRADLVSRDTGGRLYRQYGDGKGSFGSRTLLGSGWGGYTSLS
ncbi:FG-GAP repeat domain-containing protein [Streptomyces sp. NPDC049687]|uniref:FG-GAP repeat domain-containing protein n=1 Tax=Streptomyces sp. NPDC049687 TaxID=3365596 RepID=UPI003790C43B